MHGGTSGIRYVQAPAPWRAARSRAGPWRLGVGQAAVPVTTTCTHTSHHHRVAWMRCRRMGRQEPQGQQLAVHAPEQLLGRGRGVARQVRRGRRQPQPVHGRHLSPADALCHDVDGLPYVRQPIDGHDACTTQAARCKQGAPGKYREEPRYMPFGKQPTSAPDGSCLAARGTGGAHSNGSTHRGEAGQSSAPVDTSPLPGRPARLAG